uniref:Pentatricopeptide repeat-containing protein n=1 Tax=Brassica campestris TaxID=3711 RepID=M4EMZ0_BRACM
MTLPPSELAIFVADGVMSAKTPRKKKKMMFEELKDVSEMGGTVEETLNAFTTKEEYGVSITKADLVRWSILIDRYGRPEISVQIFEWMEKKEMKFTPSQLATFVDFIDRVHSIRAALDYFESVDPDFDNMDYKAKNWSAYDFLARSMSKNWNKRPCCIFYLSKYLYYTSRFS